MRRAAYSEGSVQKELLNLDPVLLLHGCVVKPYPSSKGSRQLLVLDCRCCSLQTSCLSCIRDIPPAMVASILC